MNNNKKLRVSAESMLTAAGDTGAGHTLAAGAYTNPTDTVDKAPVLLNIIPDSTVDADQFAQRLQERSGENDMSAARARYLCNAYYDTLAEIAEEYGAFSLQTAFGTITLRVKGSLGDPHQPLDPDENTAYLSVELLPEWRKAFAAMDAVIASRGTDAAVSLVRNKTDDNVSENVIVGTNPFYIDGSYLTYGHPGEKVELVDANGAHVEDIIVDATEPSNFTCHLADEVPAGKYKVVVTTLGMHSKDGETLYALSSLHFVNVKAAEPVDWPSAPTTGVNLLVDARSESTYGIKQIVKSEAGASFTVDWGDGTTPADYTATQSNLSHTYAQPGVYRVTISGAVDSVMIGDQEITPDPLWGVKYPSMVAKVQYVAASSGAILADFFARGAKNLKSVDVSGGDFRDLSSGAYMGCAKLESLALPSSIVTIKEGPLVGCAKLATLSGFPNVDDVEGDGSLQPFADCAALTAVHFAAAHREDVQDTACYRANQKFGLPNGEIVYDL